MFLLKSLTDRPSGFIDRTPDGSETVDATHPSAIIAAKGAIDADDEDASNAIAAILALGAFSLFAFPVIGHWMGLSDRAFGLWAGLAVDNTAEATAAGAVLGCGW